MKRGMLKEGCTSTKSAAWGKQTLRVLSVLLTLPGVLLTTGCTIDKQIAKEPATVRMVAYNIRHGEGMDKRIGLKRIADVIARESPDLVALQEVDKNCSRSGRTDIAAVLGGLLTMEYRFGAFMNYQGGEYGLAALSRWPIIESIRHELPSGAEPRCALELVVQPPDMQTPLSFVCIHNDWTSADFRVQQIQALLDAVKARKHPVILAGDFNGERTDASMKLLTASGWTILQKDNSAESRTWPSDKPEIEIDFFVVRGADLIAVEHRVIDERVASDHRPISAVITLR